ncbi:uncharacterized protein [Elaeis guineensis]|uniref:uncharacterized protein n=1 Tax=Elaeis guineensis var. tenera TaxID=51953 RepID=UPI003C6DA943
MATLQSLRKAYGALKDSTTVGLANLNSDFKDLDVAIVKATNHVECPPKERHLRKILAATSIARPRADVAYCIHALSRRLAKTHNWTYYFFHPSSGFGNNHFGYCLLHCADPINANDCEQQPKFALNGLSLFLSIFGGERRRSWDGAGGRDGVFPLFFCIIMAIQRFRVPLERP